MSTSIASVVNTLYIIKLLYIYNSTVSMVVNAILLLLIICYLNVKLCEIHIRMFSVLTYVQCGSCTYVHSALHMHIL